MDSPLHHVGSRIPSEPPIPLPEYPTLQRQQREREAAEKRRRRERKAADKEAESRHNAVPSLFGEKVENSIAERDEYAFEMWVEVEGQKVPVHGSTREVFDCSQGWIQSEIGKHYTVNARVKRKIIGLSKNDTYPDMDVSCYIDGVYVGGHILSGEKMFRSKGSTSKVEGRRMSPTTIRKFRFAAPAVTEELTPNFKPGEVGVISVRFQRCKQGVRRKEYNKSREQCSADETSALVGPINEKEKKTSKIISTVTAYGDTIDIEPSSHKIVSSVKIRPSDDRKIFYEMRLQYAPSDVLEAEGHLPSSLKPKIAEGDPGLMEDQPIDLDEDEESVAPVSAKVEPDLTGDLDRAAAAAESSAQARVRAEATQRKIAEIEARRQERVRLDQEDKEEIRRLKQDSGADKVPQIAKGKRQALSDPEEKPDEKPDFSGGAKRCKVLVKEEEVDGKVVVTIKDEEE